MADSKPCRPHHRNLPLLLLQARERVISYFRPILNAHGITEQQWRIVRVLLEAPALEPRQIGELCAISSPSMAGVLERMEQAGYITRRRVQHDQRRVLVSLTAKSRRLASEMSPDIEATYRRLEDTLGMEFSNQLQCALDYLFEKLPLLEISSDTGIDRSERRSRRPVRSATG